MFPCYFPCGVIEFTSLLLFASVSAAVSVTVFAFVSSVIRFSFAAAVSASVSSARSTIQCGVEMCGYPGPTL